MPEEIVRPLYFVIEVPHDRRKTFWTRPSGKLEYWAFKNRPRAFRDETIVFTFGNRPVAQAKILHVETPGRGQGEYKHWHKIYWNPASFKRYRSVTATDKKAGWVGPVFHGTTGTYAKLDGLDGMTYFTDDAEYANYFATNRDSLGAKWTEGSQVYPAYIKLGKPFDARGYDEKMTAEEVAAATGANLNDLWAQDVAPRERPSSAWFWRWLRICTRVIKAALQKQGYDSIILSEAQTAGEHPETTSFVTFSPNQIRSFTGEKAPKKFLNMRTHEAADEWLYHVTLQKNVDDILKNGLKAERGYQYFNDTPRGTYLTERTGLPFWQREIAGYYPEPQVVLKVQRKGLNLIPDEQGTEDADAAAYRVEQDIPASMIKLAAAQPLSKEFLEQIAWEARDKVCPNGDCDGKCQDVADIIVERLESLGYTDAYTAHGQFRMDDRHPHAWVRVGEWEIDATQDQFAGWFEGEGLEDNPVYVGKSRGWFHTGAKKTADHVSDEGFWAGEGNAASGVLPICPATGNVCLAMRSSEVMSPNCWGTIGGAVQKGLSPQESAKTEMAEETGYHGGINLIPAFVFASSGGFKYHNYIGVVGGEFAFHPGEEHGWETDYIQWIPYAEVVADMKKNPSDYHPGLIALFKNSQKKIEQALGLDKGKDPKTGAQKNPKLDEFMKDLWAQTTSNPFNNRERVWQNKAVIEARPFDGRIHLSFIRSVEPKKGWGTEGLKFLTALAEKHGVEIDLGASPVGKGGLNESQLISWYKRHGFDQEPDMDETSLIYSPQKTLKLGPNMKTIPMGKKSNHNPACRCEMCRTIEQWRRPWLTGKCHEFALALSTQMPDAQFVAIGTAMFEHVGLRKGDVYYDVRGQLTKDQFVELFGSNTNSLHDVSREQVMKDSYPSYIGHEDELIQLPDFRAALRAAKRAFGKVKKGALEFKDTNRDYHHGQSDQTLTAYVGGKPVGYMEYGVFEKEPHVQWLEVFDKRKGYGTALLKELQRMYPEAEVNLGMLTDDGGKLIDTMKFNEQPTEYNEKYNELEVLTKERDKLQQVADEYYARENHTEEEKQGFMQQMENMNNIHDRIWELEQETFNKPRTKRYIAAEQQHMFPNSQDANFRKWFAGSKVVDKDGRPMPVYHGTRSSADFDTFSTDGPPLEDTQYGDSAPTSSGSGSDPTAYLGAHFAEEHGVANQFAEGKGWTRTRYEGEQPKPRVIQVFLHITNPKDFGLEENLRHYIYQGKVTEESLLGVAMLGDGINPLEEDSVNDQGDTAEEWYQRYESDVPFRAASNQYLFEQARMEEGEEDALQSAGYDLAQQARQKLTTGGFDGVRYKNAVEGGNAWIVFDANQVKSVWAQQFNPEDTRFTASKSATAKSSVLYLDDCRKPLRPGIAWVKNYDEFVEFLTNNEMPDVVTFDHDLALEHYPADIYDDRDRRLKGIPYHVYQIETGLDAAKYIVQNNLPLKNWAVHSANPIGRENIRQVLKAYRPNGEVNPNVPFINMEKSIYKGEIEHGFRIAPWEKRAAGFAFRTFSKLWHIGSMNSKDKRPGSYEGAGLSVSVNPDEWQYIAGIAGDLWELTKQGNRFLNFHRVSKQQRAQITQWGIKNGFVEPVTTYKVEFFDEEDQETRYHEYLDKAEAEADAKSKIEDEGIEDTKVVEDTAALNPTPKLLQRSHASRSEPTMAWDYLVVVYAEDMLQCDGVWWADRLDQYALSAPRGVIFKDKLSSWKFRKVRAAAGKTKPTPTQLAALGRMLSADGTIHRERGGFWVSGDAIASWDKFGLPKFKGEEDGQMMLERPWVDVRTVRAMEKRGWVERINQFPEEWRDVRKITDAGQLLLMNKTSALEPDSIDVDPDKEFDQMYEYMNSLDWRGRNPWYPEKYPFFAIRLYSDGWKWSRFDKTEAEGNGLADLKAFLSKYDLAKLRTPKTPTTIDAQPVQKKLTSGWFKKEPSLVTPDKNIRYAPLEYEDIGSKNKIVDEVLPPLEYEDIGAKRKNSVKQ